MARQRRGPRGRELPSLPGLAGLGSLIKSTLASAGAVREVIERGAREGKSRIDEALAERRRKDLLAELGEAVLGLLRAGEIELDDLPELRDLVADLDQLDADGEVPEVARPASRERFDARLRDAADGTVSSSHWTPPTPPARAPGPPGPPTWRPPGEPTARPRSAEPTQADPLTRMVEQATRKGGITFDDDLADYMHPDDVPPRDKPDGNGA
jgi:hypothetical protein